MLPRHVSLLAAAFRTTQTSGRARQRPVLYLGSSIHGLGASRSPPRSESGQSQGSLRPSWKGKPVASSRLGDKGAPKTNSSPRARQESPGATFTGGWGVGELRGGCNDSGERTGGGAGGVCAAARRCAASPVFLCRPPFVFLATSAARRHLLFSFIPPTSVFLLKDAFSTPQHPLLCTPSTSFLQTFF